MFLRNGMPQLTTFKQVFVRMGKYGPRLGAVRQHHKHLQTESNLSAPRFKHDSNCAIEPIGSGH